MIARLLLAARASGASVELSLPSKAEFSGWSGKVWQESDGELAGRLATAGYGLLRAPAASPALAAAASAAGVRLVSHAPVLNGRIELLPYFREQAISETLHRHGAVLPKPAGQSAAGRDKIA